MEGFIKRTLTFLAAAAAVSLAAHGATAAENAPPPAPASTPAAKAEARPEGKPISLEDSINAALGRHPRIKGAEEDFINGKYKTLEAQAAYWPQVSFAASREYMHSGAASSAGFSANSVSNSFALSGSWTLFDFGRTYWSVKGSRAVEDSLLKTLSATEQAVAYDVMDAYYGLLKSQSLVKVSEESLAAANSHLKQAQAFFEVGVKPKFDVTKAEVEVNTAKVALLQAKDAVRAARATLNTKMGINALTPTVVEERPRLEELAMPMDGYFKEALSNRPDLLSIEAQMRANELAVRGAKANFLPTLSASGAYGWANDDHSDFADSNNLQVQVSVPIFEGFRTVARVGEARAAALSTRYKMEDTKLGILNDVTSAFIAVEDAKARYEALETSVREAKENLEIAQGRYEAGVGPIIDVTDAQVSLTKAETDRAGAFYDYHLAYSKLLRSTGKGVRAEKTAGK